MTGELAVKYHASSDPQQFPYIFDIKLTESAGVSATITGVLIAFDEGWGLQCNWAADQFWQPDLAAKGTLALEPMICQNWHGPPNTWSADVWVSLKDANGHVITVAMWQWF